MAQERDIEIKRLHIGNVGTGLALVLALFACGGGEPKEWIFELEIRDQALAQTESVLQVKQNDVVTLVVTADEHIAFHLHGYDIKQEAQPGEPATLEFTANATGSFPFSIHTRPEEDHEHHTEADSCEAELPPGAPTPGVSFTASLGEGPGEINVAVELKNFVLDPAPKGTELAVGHWHLYISGELQGMYAVPEATGLVKYSGEHQVMVTLAGPNHCSYGIQAMTMIIVEEGSMDGEKEHEKDKEEEIELGRLEVQPR